MSWGTKLIDSLANTWIGTSGGLARFDGTIWTVYNTSNSGLPENSVKSIAKRLIDLGYSK